MIIDEFEYTLKDGRRAIMRSPKEDDIHGMLDFLRLASGETEFIIRYPEEVDELTYEREKAFVDDINTSGNKAMLVCIVDGRLVGNCEIVWSNRIKTRHRAQVAIAIIKEYWNQGIGTRFFEELIRIAQENTNITQMELNFIEGNSRARALYEKMGFRISGVVRNAIRLKDGTLLNEYSMIREVRSSSRALRDLARDSGQL